MARNRLTSDEEGLWEGYAIGENPLSPTLADGVDVDLEGRHFSVVSVTVVIPVDASIKATKLFVTESVNICE